MVPANVRELVVRGHEVIVEASAGDGIGASDEQYRLAGADSSSSRRRKYSNTQS